MKKDLITQIIASLLILLFSYAASSKLLEYQTFLTQLGKSPFIDSYADVVSVIIPAAELVIVAFLLFPRRRLIGFYASFFLMMLFTAYIYMMLHFSYDLPCSCGGVLADLSWQQHFVFNIVFTVISFLGIVFQSPDNKLAHFLSFNYRTNERQDKIVH